MPPRQAARVDVGSEIEEIFASQCYNLKVPASEREYRFHAVRKWRFDFAWPEHKIAAEIEGGVWTNGRHTRGSGFTKDCEKYNAAAELGWLVFRFPETMVNDWSGAEQIKRALESIEL